MEEYTDVMLDIETMGKMSNSAIMSIGAVEFNMNTGNTGREFYKVVDLQSCLNLGLKIEASTVYFWLQQNQTARDAICHNPEHLKEVLKEFYIWMQDCIENINIWGNGARFDIGIMEDAYYACQISTPWYFRSERDVRTLVAFAPDIKTNMIFNGIEHHPIADSKHQIKYCSAIWNKMHPLLNN